MAQNLVIGLGGTGGKLIESFLHVCGAGLGPEHETAVAFLEQDKDNGNTTRAREGLSDYIDVHEMLHGAEGDYRVPANFRYIKTKLVPHRDPNRVTDQSRRSADIERCLWSPHERNTTLADLINYRSMSDTDRDLAKVLFDDSVGGGDSAELEMKLDEGYRGRPHVGSAALLVELENSEWMKWIRDMIAANSQRDVNIVLCGSAFGGTGAAALPTLAREIREFVGNASNVAISGVMMLPYFTFAEEEKENAARSAMLLQQTGAALNYYDGWLKDEAVFRDLYLVGWDKMFRLNYHSPGSKSQRNPPLAPELVGALAMSRALGGSMGDVRQNTLNGVSRSIQSELDWKDLPSVDEGGRGRSVRDHMGGFLRFCFMWQADYRKAIRDESGKKMFRSSWFKGLLGNGFVKDTGRPDALDKMDDYVERALKWAALMSAYSNETGDKHMFRLWNYGSFASVDPAKGPLQSAHLMTAESDPLSERMEALNRILNLSDEDKQDDPDEVHRALAAHDGVKSSDGSDVKGLGSFLKALQDVTALRSAQGGQ